MSVIDDMLDNFSDLLYEMTGAPPGQITLRDQVDAARLIPPYLTVGFNAADVVLGEDEHVIVTDDGTGDSVYRTIAPRGATLSVQGYGSDTSDWLTLLRIRLSDKSYVRRIAEDVNISAYPVGGVSDVTRLVESSRERRYSMDIELAYHVIIDRAVTNVATVDVNAAFESPNNDPLALDATIDVT